MSTYGLTNKNIKEKCLRHKKSYMIWKAVKNLRIYEYCCESRDKTNCKLLLYLKAIKVKIAERRFNKSCEKVNIELTPHLIEKNIRICHGNVIIFGSVGENCIFHGNNVLGNKRTGDKNAIPKLGKNVDVGFGAIIIGDVEIADNCVIGAGAVVTKSFTKTGTVIAGVPAKEISKGNGNE